MVRLFKQDSGAILLVAVLCYNKTSAEILHESSLDAHAVGVGFEVGPDMRYIECSDIDSPDSQHRVPISTMAAGLSHWSHTQGRH